MIFDGNVNVGIFEEKILEKDSTAISDTRKS